MTYKDIQKEIGDANEEARWAAEADFSNNAGRDLLVQCHRLTEETSERYALVMKGESPRAFGEYDRDEVAHILSLDVVITFDGYTLDMSTDAETIKDWREAAVKTQWQCDAYPARDRLAFIAVYEKYLYTAALFAKSIGAEHAMRLYLRAWGLVSEAHAQNGQRARLAPDDALRTVNLERVATERLWEHVVAAKLPKFTPSQKAKARVKPKSAQTRKRKTRAGGGAI